VNPNSIPGTPTPSTTTPSAGGAAAAENTNKAEKRKARVRAAIGGLLGLKNPLKIEISLINNFIKNLLTSKIHAEVPFYTLTDKYYRILTANQL
jgi:hypothetical protein